MYLLKICKIINLHFEYFIRWIYLAIEKYVSNSSVMYYLFRETNYFVKSETLLFARIPMRWPGQRRGRVNTEKSNGYW